MNDSRLPRYTILAGVFVIGSSFAAFFLNLTGRGFFPLLGFLRTLLPGVATGTLLVAIGWDARRSPRSRLALSGCFAVGVVVASVLAWRALGALLTGPSVGDGLFFGVYVAGALAAVVLWAVSVWTT